MALRVSKRVSLFVVLSTLISLPAFSQEDDIQMGDPMGFGIHTESVVTSTKALEKLRKRKAEVDADIAKCTPDEKSSVVTCKGPWLTYSKSKASYDSMVEQSKELAQSIMHTAEQVKQDNVTEKDVKKKDINSKYLTKANWLLKNVKDVQTDLKVSGLEVKTLMLQYDQTLLGEYSRYVAREYAKSKEMQAQICKTVSTCSDIVKMKGETDKSSKAVLDYQEYRRKAEQDRAKAAPAPAAPAAPPAAQAQPAGMNI